MRMKSRKTDEATPLHFPPEAISKAFDSASSPKIKAIPLLATFDEAQRAREGKIRRLQAMRKHWDTSRSSLKNKRTRDTEAIDELLAPMSISQDTFSERIRKRQISPVHSSVGNSDRNTDSVELPSTAPIADHLNEVLICSSCHSKEAELWCCSCLTIFCTLCWTKIHETRVDLHAAKSNLLAPIAVGLQQDPWNKTFPDLGQNLSFWLLFQHIRFHAHIVHALITYVLRIMSADTLADRILGSRAQIVSAKALLDHKTVSDLIDEELGPENIESDVVNESLLMRRLSLTQQEMPPFLMRATGSLMHVSDNLKSALVERQIKCAEDVMKQYDTILHGVMHLKATAHALDSKCTSMETYAANARQQSTTFASEFGDVMQKRNAIKQDLMQVETFLKQYQLTEEELSVLYSEEETESERFMDSLFEVMERLKEMKHGCRTLIAAENPSLSIQVLESVSKYQDVGFKRVYQWAGQQCTQVDRCSSDKLRRAIVLLQDRHEFYNYCKESLALARRSFLSNQFISALTQEGLNGRPPIDWQSHDPIRYCEDMLSWVHEVVVTEQSLLSFLLDGDFSYQVALEESCEKLGELEKSGMSDMSTPTMVTTDVSIKVFEKVAELLQHRLENVVRSSRSIVIAFRLLHVLSGFRDKSQHEANDSPVANVLETCYRDCFKNFKSHLKVMTETISYCTSEYTRSLTACPKVMTISHQLSELLQVSRTSLISASQREEYADLLFRAVTTAIREFLDKSVIAMDPLESFIFRLNNMEYFQLSLQHPAQAYKSMQDMNAFIQTWIANIVKLETQHTVKECSLAKLVDESLEPREYPDIEQVVVLMETFSCGLGTLTIPHLSLISQPSTRDSIQLQVAQNISQIYGKIFSILKGLQTETIDHTAKLHSPQQVLAAINP